MSGFKPRFLKVENFDQQAEYVSSKIRLLLDQGVAPDEIVILARRWRSLTLLRNTPEFVDLPIDQSYKRSGDKPDLALLALILITQWWAAKPKRSDYPFTYQKSLTRVLKYLGLGKEMREIVLSRVDENGWEELGIPKKMGNSKYRLILDLRKAVIAAAKLSPESGIQLLIDALKPAIPLYVKNDKLRILSEWGKIKVQLRDHPLWASITPRSLKFPVYHERGIEMLTIHKSKGREWSYVFLIDVVEAEFPLYFHRSQLDEDQERRVFYVAISRVMKRLTIIQSPVTRNNFKKGKVKNTKTPNLLSDSSCFINNYYSTMRKVSHNSIVQTNL